MPIDYTKIKKKIVGAEDGQDTLRLRTGVVDAVNVNGTVDLLLSGVLMTGVPKLSEAVVGEDEPVQVLTYRGSMLVIGGVAGNSSAIGQQPFVRDASTSSSSAISNTETVVSTLASRTYRAGRAYEVWVGGGQLYSAASSFSAWTVRKGTTTGGATVLGPMRQTNGLNTASQALHLNLRSLFVIGGSDVTTQLCLTLVTNTGGGNTTHFASATDPRHFTILPAGFASAWTNAATLS